VSTHKSTLAQPKRASHNRLKKDNGGYPARLPEPDAPPSCYGFNFFDQTGKREAFEQHGLRQSWYLARSKALSVGLSNKYFNSLGLPSIWHVLAKLREPPYTRTYGGGEGGAVRRPPIRISDPQEACEGVLIAIVKINVGIFFR